MTPGPQEEHTTPCAKPCRGALARRGLHNLSTTNYRHFTRKWPGNSKETCTLNIPMQIHLHM
eukprot:3302918-Lingulodinium_polyedra.AAC.1